MRSKFVRHTADSDRSYSIYLHDDADPSPTRIIQLIQDEPLAKVIAQTLDIELRTGKAPTYDRALAIYQQIGNKMGWR